MTRRYRAKVDTNQKSIVDAYRSAGATVEPTHATGGGFPDLVVGFRGVNFLVEVVGPDKLSRFRKNGGLSDGQVEWHKAWRGTVHKVSNVAEALAVLGIEYRGVIS